MRSCELHINNISLKFGNYTVLEDIDFCVGPETFVSIVGPNGGGKTTLLKIILGIIKPNKGSIKIDEMNIADVPSEYIGYVPQIKTLDRSFPAIPLELVASGIKNKWSSRIDSNTKDLIFDALKKVGAEHLAYRQLSKLSGGELQRIYLARSFVRKPKLLLLDEPATGIDFIGENDIHNIIEEYRKESDAIIIMVTHDWEAAYHHSDKVLLLNRKQICYNVPTIAFNDENLRSTFSHVGHKHDIVFGVHSHD